MLAARRGAAIGAMPSASADGGDAARAGGIILEEKIGASTNSGETRASTRMKPSDLLLAELREDRLGFIRPPASGIWPYSSCG